MKELNELMTIALTLIKCSKEKCTTTQQKMMQDKEILKEIIVVNLESNLAKKKNLIEKLNKNKLVYENNKCILNNCLEIYKKLLIIVNTAFTKLPLSIEVKNEGIRLLNNTRKLLATSNIKEKDILKIIINFTLIQELLKPKT